MDRIEAMRVFVTALDEGSLAAAGRRLNRSAAAVTRAISFLEAHVGTQLLHRTTRAIKLSEAGERYATACRRVLAELEEADLLAAGETAAPRGLLTLTGPLSSGAHVLRPVLDAFLTTYPAVKARLHLLDRKVALIDEGIDVAMRIAHLPDSSLIAMRLGEVRRVVVGAPAYLAGRPKIAAPADLADHQCIAMNVFGSDNWTFPQVKPGAHPQIVKIEPRLVVNTIEAAIASAVEGNGLTRLFSYQVADAVRDGRLELVLVDPPSAALPVHLLTPEGRLAVSKVRAFFDFAVPRLKAEFARISQL
ncbi:LysR family transcriptional regulator [Dongia sp.]|uniref:LysR family transcriptional regulator n=1 Tax=Dongia sp. TaxID=1977262 RepID=UPI0035AF5142